MTTIEEVKAMSDDERREYTKKLGKELAKKVIIGVSVSVVVHVLSNLIIKSLDKKDESEETPED